VGGQPQGGGGASDVVFSIVGFPHDVREVILGDDGVLAGCKKGNVLVDMTTSEPSLAVEICRAGKEKGVTASTRRSRAATSAPARPGSPS
jgi:3-hydroxyisobutyrate dehydrogenase